MLISLVLHLLLNYFKVKEQIRMKYINATEVLPLDLLNEIQKHISGEILYIPQPEGKKNPWGSRKGTRQEIVNRKT